MIWFQIFWEFFKAGLFAAGGGLATLPFLYAISESTGWFSTADIANMIAISESTPGPLGVNMATYAGYRTEGLIGALVAPLSLVLPSVIIIIFVSKILDRFKTSSVVQHTLYGLRAASSGLIAAAGIGVAKTALLHLDALQGAATDVMAVIHWKAVVLAIVLYWGLKKFKKHPIVYIVAAAVAGVAFKF